MSKFPSKDHNPGPRRVFQQVLRLGVQRRGALLNDWPIIMKVWLGIVSTGFLVVAYRVDRGKKYSYWSQRLRLAPIAMLTFLVFVAGLLVLRAFDLVTF